MTERTPSARRPPEGTWFASGICLFAAGVVLLAPRGDVPLPALGSSAGNVPSPVARAAGALEANHRSVAAHGPAAAAGAVATVAGADPATALVFTVVGAPPDWNGACAIEVSAADGRAWRRTLAACDAEAGVRARVDAGAPLAWRAVATAGAPLFDLRGATSPLCAGEHRRVVVDLRAAARTRLRVEGVEPALLPHLRIGYRTAEHAFCVALADVSGAVEVLGDALRAELGVVALDGCVDLLPAAAADGGRERVVRPVDPLAGVWLADEGGGAVPARLVGWDGPVDSGLERRTVHVVRRRALGALRKIVASPEAGRDLVFDREAFAGRGDLVALDPRLARSSGSIAVRVRGELPPGFALLEAVDAQGVGRVLMPLRQAVALACDLAPGVYDVQWFLGGWRVPVASVAVHPGSETEMIVDAPATVSWRGEVAGLAELPAQHHLRRVHLDGAPASMSNWSRAVQIAADGTFACTLPVGAVPRGATLWQVEAPLAAELRSVDEAARRVVVAVPPGLRWVALQVEGASTQDWWAQLDAPAPGRSETLVAALVASEHATPIAVPPGVVLQGLLVVRDGADDVTRAWIEIDGTRPAVAVRADEGRVVTVRRALGAPADGVQLVGPRGQLGSRAAWLGSRELELFVPAGTRGLRVGDQELPIDGLVVEVR